MVLEQPNAGLREAIGDKRAKTEHIDQANLGGSRSKGKKKKG